MRQVTLTDGELEALLSRCGVPLSDAKHFRRLMDDGVIDDDTFGVSVDRKRNYKRACNEIMAILAQRERQARKGRHALRCFHGPHCSTLRRELLDYASKNVDDPAIAENIVGKAFAALSAYNGQIHNVRGFLYRKAVEGITRHYAQPI